MKMTFGRKFFAALMIAACMTTIMMFSLLAVNPSPVTATVIICYFAFITLDFFMYVGGNVYNSFIKSKYFQPDLVGVA